MNKASVYLLLGALLSSVPTLAGPVPCEKRESGPGPVVEFRVLWPSKSKGDPQDVENHFRTLREAYEALGVRRVVLTYAENDYSSLGVIAGSDEGDSLHFGQLDALVAGLSPMGVVVLSSTDPADHQGFGLPNKLTAFENYVKALVERYDGDTDFGVPLQDQAYPDIDGSGNVTIADWSASAEDKQKWADSHRIAGVLVEPRMPDDLETYASVLSHVAKVVSKVSFDVEVWIPPLPPDLLSREATRAVYAVLQERLGDTLNGLVLMLDVSNLVDPTATKYSELLATFQQMVVEALPDVSPKRVTLAAAGVSIPRGGPACTDSRCGPRLQAETLVKLLARAALEVPYGFSVAYAGLLVDAAHPSGSSLVTASRQQDGGWVVSEVAPALPLAYVVARALNGERREDYGLEPVATTGVRGYPCAGVDTAVLWYDWTREVGPEADYSGLTKTVAIDFPTDSTRAYLLDLDEQEATKMLSMGDVWLPEARFETDAKGQVRLVLGRTPLLLVHSPELSASEQSKAEAGAEGIAASEGVTGQESGGGCMVAASNPVCWWQPLLLWVTFVGVTVTHRRVGQRGRSTKKST